jgi:hypothetical protein
MRCFFIMQAGENVEVLKNDYAVYGAVGICKINDVQYLKQGQMSEIFQLTLRSVEYGVQSIVVSTGTPDLHLLGHEKSVHIRWKLRMRSLPEEQQMIIAEKYYGGRCSWKDALL